MINVNDVKKFLLLLVKRCHVSRPISLLVFRIHHWISIDTNDTDVTVLVLHMRHDQGVRVSAPPGTQGASKPLRPLCEHCAQVPPICRKHLQTVVVVITHKQMSLSICSHGSRVDFVFHTGKIACNEKGVRNQTEHARIKFVPSEGFLLSY